MLVISRAKDDERKEGPELAFSESAPPGFSNKVSDFKEEHSQLRSSWLVSWRKFFIHEGSLSVFLFCREFPCHKVTWCEISLICQRQQKL